MAELTFNQVVQAAQQLPPEQQSQLIQLLKAGAQHSLSAEDRKQMLSSIIIPMDTWPENWSLNREDWYDDETL